MAGVKKYKTKKEKKALMKHHSEYNTKFIKENYRRFEIKLKLEEEADIIAYLEGVANRNEYIKNLILKDIEENK